MDSNIQQQEPSAKMLSRKEVTSHWKCDVTTAKSTEVCVIKDYDNEDNTFNPDLFTKLYQSFYRK